MPFAWTLIIMRVGPGVSAGAAIDHIQFANMAACEAARDAVLKEWVSSLNPNPRDLHQRWGSGIVRNHPARSRNAPSPRRRCDRDRSRR
jgi:hypothetical protein